MKNTDLKLLFEGTKAIDKTEKLLWSLYKKMMHDASHTEAERAFFLAFEGRELLNSDGFEKLFEQSSSLEQYADSLVKVGLPQTQQVFDQVVRLVPPELCMPGEEDALYELLDELFDELQELLNKFFDATQDMNSVLLSFLRTHKEDFAKYIN